MVLIIIFSIKKVKKKKNQIQTPNKKTPGQIKKRQDKDKTRQDKRMKMSLILLKKNGLKNYYCCLVFL
jgi:hypothetical protein